MDRRQFLQTGGALALTCSPATIALGQASWIPPYAVPSSGQVISLTVPGGNTLNEVATAANGWGEYYTSFLRANSIYSGDGFGAFAEDYSTAGAMAIAGTGGHHAGGIWGGFIFDFTTGMWISKANTNGKTETRADPLRATVDWATGELLDKTGISGQLPIPGHGYTWHFCPPKAVGGGNKGYLIKPCVVAGSDEGWDAPRSFKFDLDTGLWTYASDNTINFDGAYLNPYTDGGGDWDPVTSRFYSPQKGAYTGQLRYLERTPTGWTWKKTSCPNLRNNTLHTVFVNGRDLVIGYMDNTWQKVNLDDTAGGATYINMVNAHLLPLPTYFFTRWHKYPVDGCWYALRGKSDRAAITSWPNDGSPMGTQAAEQYLLRIDPATWTVSRDPIAGGILAAWESRYASHQHGNGFVYVPKLQCFAWFARHDSPIQLIKPGPHGGSGGGDTQPPTVPASLQVTLATTSSIAWAWNPSTDGGGGYVAGYKAAFYAGDNTPIGGLVDVGNVLTYTRSGLEAATTYKLAVSAYDNATPANESSLCAAVAGTTSVPADTLPPTVPSDLRVTATTTTSLAWAWNASTDAGGGTVAGYRVSLYDSNDVALVEAFDAANVLTYTANALKSGTTYRLRVAAYDNATPVNVSALSAAVAGTTSASVDTEPPTVPANLRVTSTTSSSITWAWTESTDMGGGTVAGYKVALYDNSGVQMDIVDVGNVLTYARSVGLSPGMTYNLRVSAYDNAAPRNESAPCAAVAGTTTTVADTQAPTVPAILRVKEITASSLTWTWNASTDNGGGSVAGYRVALYDGAGTQLGGFVDVGNTLVYKASNLTANTSYKLRVSAYDNAVPRNESAFCAAVTGLTKKKDPPGKTR